MASEASIEQYLIRACRSRGILCEKFVAPGRRAVPDRILTAPGGQIAFVECKASGASPRENQKRDHEKRRERGAIVRVVDSRESVLALLNELCY